MKRQNSRGWRGFTLVEVMIVLGIITLLATIAVPNFVKARETSRARSCSKNLKTIEIAKETWMMENQRDRTDAPTAADLYGVGKYVRNEPTCPSGGNYTIGSGDENPICDFGGGSLHLITVE